MPALEIMPHCGTMDEAQHRARLQLKLRQSPSSTADSKGKNDSVSVVAPSGTTSRAPVSHALHRRRNAASNTIKGFFKRLRHSSASSKKKKKNKKKKTVATAAPATFATNTIPPTTTTTTTARTPKDDGTPDGIEATVIPPAGKANNTAQSESMGYLEENCSSFSTIGVRYWGRINEDEEEEPPEAWSE